jgi:hypothetical protein
MRRSSPRQRLLVVLGAVAFSIAGLGTDRSQAQGGTQILHANEFLRTGEYIVSDPANTPQSFTIMQADGNLCMYRGSGPGDNQGNRWCSHSQGRTGDYFAIMQGDGNLCVYAGTGPSDNRGSRWCSNTNGSTDPGNDYWTRQLPDALCISRSAQDPNRPKLRERLWCKPHLPRQEPGPPPPPPAPGSGTPQPAPTPAVAHLFM